jgi:hypothetical protein
MLAIQMVLTRIWLAVVVVVQVQLVKVRLRQFRAVWVAMVLLQQFLEHQSLVLVVAVVLQLGLVVLLVVLVVLVVAELVAQKQGLLERQER